MNDSYTRAILDGMGREPLVPQPPLESHCWVWGRDGYRADPVPGIIIGWNLQPTADAGPGAGWLVQVAIQRAPANLVIDWVASKRVSPVKDRKPGGTRRGVRHVWRRPLTDGMAPAPGLLIDWRRVGSEWEALLATSHGRGSLLVTWESAAQIVPVADDSWIKPNS